MSEAILALGLSPMRQSLLVSSLQGSVYDCREKYPLMMQLMLLPCGQHSGSLDERQDFLLVTKYEEL